MQSIKSVKTWMMALFYVQKTIQNNWSRSVLTHQIEKNLFAREGKAITNFKATLPSRIMPLICKSKNDTVVEYAI
ncbi:MAG: DUF1016 domain-containing protein [Desulfobacterales bacterium]|nr:DUF1016 domain-containing protein [Desulfobacterales bacterium]